MTHELVLTRGGTWAVRGVAEGEVMHPGVGPRAEAEALYVGGSRLEARLAAHDAETLVLFDVGLGAGANALAALAVSERAPAGSARLAIVSFERDTGGLALALDHAAALGIEPQGAAAARDLLARGAHGSARTSWRLERGDARAALAQASTRADVVFWDPFSPRANPDLWTVAAFTAIRRLAAPRATLHTYSASTTTRLAMLLGGWAVGHGPAIGDKAETTLAAVRADDLERPLDGRFLARLGRSTAPWPADAPPHAHDRVATLPQFARSAPAGA